MFKGTAHDELGIGGPAEAQNYHEGIDYVRPARRLYDLEDAPIELGPAAGLSLEPSVGQPDFAGPDSPNVAVHGVIAAVITLSLQTIPDLRRLVVIFFQIVLDRLKIGRQVLVRKRLLGDSESAP